MITGASSADAALLLIDASQGVQQQSRFHGFLLDLLGIRQVAVLVNKMDLVDNSEARFTEIRAEYTRYMAGLGVTAEQYIPNSARDGHTIVERSAPSSWYSGPTLVETLDSFRSAQRPVHRKS